MSQTSSSADLWLADRRWTARAALAFVLLTLVSLVAVPVLVQQHVTSLRREIEAFEPARTPVGSHDP